MSSQQPGRAGSRAGSREFCTAPYVVNYADEEEVTGFDTYADGQLNGPHERRMGGKVLTTRSTGSSVQPLGFMAEDIATAVEVRTGKPAARLLALSEKELVQADRVKRQKKGLTLTLAEYQTLPRIVANPSAVLWDTQTQRLMYISGDADSTLKTVVNAPWQTGRVDTLDVVVTPQRVPLSALKKGMDSGQYELLQGAL